MFLSIVSIAPVARIYVTDDGNGTVALRRLGPRQYVSVLLLLPMFLVVVLLPTALIAMVYPLGAIYVPLIASVMLLILGAWVTCGLIMMLRGRPRGASLRETGRETPRGRRYALSNLAQQPGTQWSALELARDVMNHMPAGTVLCAVAANEKLADIYIRRGGFTAGEKLRVWRIM